MTRTSFRTILASALIALVAVNSTARADEPAARPPVPHLDLGVSGGLNNPGGVYGVEADYRLFDWLSVGLGAGSGAWGYKATPQLRLYPFGVNTAGLFIEAGSSINLGSTASSTENGVTRKINEEMTATVNASLGYRIRLGVAGWLALRAGYGLKLGSDTNYSYDGGGAVTGLTKGVMDILEPGGFIVGLSGGYSIL